MTLLWVGSFVLILFAVLFSGWPSPWSGVGGALLFGLWLWGMFGRPQEPRIFRLLPGHALLFFALGRTGTRCGLYLWLAAMALTFALASAKPWVRPLWAILWPVSLAALHAVGATKLAGAAFWAWTSGLALAGLALTVREGRTILRGKG